MLHLGRKVLPSSALEVSVSAVFAIQNDRVVYQPAAGLLGLDCTDAELADTGFTLSTHNNKQTKPCQHQPLSLFVNHCHSSSTTVTLRRPLSLSVDHCHSSSTTVTPHRPLSLSVDHCHSPSTTVTLRRPLSLFVDHCHPLSLFINHCHSYDDTTASTFLNTVSKYFSKAPHIRSHIAPCSCFPKQVSFQLSSEQSVGDV